MNNETAWEEHYTRERSFLNYPDENLVRMLKGFLNDRNPPVLSALDAGCGTGRHLKLLKELGIGTILGVDLSANALEPCKTGLDIPVCLANLNLLPAKNSFFDIIISWGSLHYCNKGDGKTILKELHRVLKPGGRLMGTLRSSRDTYLNRLEHLDSNTWIIKTADLKNSVVSFFEEKEIPGMLDYFHYHRYGIMERSIIGQTDMIISHWFFWAEK